MNANSYQESPYWKAYWEGNLPKLQELLSFPPVRPLVNGEYHLLKAYLLTLVGNEEAYRSELRLAKELAVTAELELAIDLFHLEHLLLEGEFQSIGQVIGHAYYLTGLLEDSWKGLVLKGRFNYLTALYAARERGETVARHFLKEAGELAKKLPKECYCYGQAFGRIHLQAGLTFYEALLGNYQKALSLLKDKEISLLPPLSQGALLIDIALIYGELGEVEKEEAFLAKAKALLPYVLSR